ncbi:hypothetical protein DMR_32230 [Solidesulfovibrio magneticus RS-1]|uniref:SF4 helicase domain-containing protein n=2 Tax=Solidesulfovibrio TaxID=2910984 RepID=C4XJG4_SOLM1|nr:hypothetical protein DMR_32230 [Solidesulfovibrio magneticus RS-1]
MKRDLNMKKSQKTIRDVLTNIYTELETRLKMDYVITGVPTDFFEIDFYTKGFQRKDLIILAGMPNSHKTSLALNISSNTAINHGNRVFYFSLDASPEMLVKKILFQLSNTSYNHFYLNMLGYGDLKQLYKFGEIINKAPINFFCDTKYTFEKIENKCSSSKLVPKLIVVDSLQLLGDVTKDKATIEEALISFKKLAEKLNTAIVLIYDDLEGARDRYTKNEYTIDTSIFIKNNADVVFYIKNNVVISVDEDDDTQQTFKEIIIAKQKNGPCGSLRIGFNINSLLFYNTNEDLFDVFINNAERIVSC